MEIFQDYLRVALHRRSYKRYDYTTNPAHMTVRLDGTYTRFLNTLSKTPLLVLDDFGLAQTGYQYAINPVADYGRPL